MGTITVGRENSTPIELYYEDHGAGPPVVLIHGFPFSAQSWEKQTTALLHAGHRVIAYDRRGFGGSSQPTSGYDFDTFASDLNTILTTLDLHEAVLVGHSMGTGEVVRYLSTYGSKRVTRVVLIAPLGPFLLKRADNPEGIEGSAFESIMDSIARDRPAYIKSFVEICYNVDVELGARVSDEVIRRSWSVGVAASATGTLECINAWLTDFRQDLKRISIPVLVISGGQDRVLPFWASGARLQGALARCKIVVFEDAPNGLLWTHAAEVNRAIADFIDK